MDLGNKLIDLRKNKKLSQEEVADLLGVTRQTISKWETNQSTPDFDKIAPLCKLYAITPNELLMENVQEEHENINNYEDKSLKRIKKAKGISLGILIYFIAIVWIMISVPVLLMNPIVAAAIFLAICGIATYCIVYVCIMYKSKKDIKVENPNDKLRHQIESVVSIIVTIIYLLVSFITMAWHITWIIWVVYGLFVEILKLIFMLRGIDDEK